MLGNINGRGEKGFDATEGSWNTKSENTCLKYFPSIPISCLKSFKREVSKLRQKGSHIIMMNDKGVRIVVPVHPGKEVKPGLVKAIIKEAGLTREEFLKLLKEI
ncbi:MAG: type II toxin-antitoxin system HicA family toxin [Thermoproteota archaeon]